MDIYYITSLLCTSLWVPISVNILIKRNLGVTRRGVCTLLMVLIYLTSGWVDYTEIAFLWMFPLWAMIVYWGMGKSKWDILYIPLSYVIIAFCNYLLTWFTGTYLGIDFIDTFVDSKLQLLLAILITPLVVIVSFVVKNGIRLFKKTLKGTVSKETVGLAIGNLILYTAVYLINSWASRNMELPDEISDLNLLIFLAYTLLAIGNLAIAFRVIRGQEQKRQEKEERKNLLEYTKNVESMYDELRIFRHDYINILATLSGYMEKEDMTSMKRYFEENILPTTEKINQGSFHLQKLSKIEHPAIKGLISSKLIYAHSKGIDVFVDIVDMVNNIPMRIIDFTRVMGIYLDNAIEAALESEKKEIKFNVIQETEMVTVTLVNSFKGKDITISEMEKRAVSTKGEGRGLGLANVNEILQQYTNISKVTELNGDYFSQTLIIREVSQKGTKEKRV